MPPLPTSAVRGGHRCDRPAPGPDTTLVENVDGAGRPAPAGQPGARLLVTNLHNLVQPLFRLEVTDLVTLDPDPCPCGRTLVRAAAIHGRSDDILSLPARDGGRVAVHPLHFALLTRDPQVREFQVVQDGRVLRILVVPAPAATDGDGALEARLGQAVTGQLQGWGSTTRRSPSSAAMSCRAQPAASSSS